MLKIVTMCGSFKFRDLMIKEAIALEFKGNIVLMPIFPISLEENAYTDGEKKILGDIHKERIKLSDAIYVVNEDNYIGSSTKEEIELAKSLGKEIIYYKK